MVCLSPVNDAVKLQWLIQSQGMLFVELEAAIVAEEETSEAQPEQPGTISD
jgi:hypothetical protein